MTVTVGPAGPQDVPEISRLLRDYLTATETEKAAHGLAVPGPLPSRYQHEIDRPEELLAGTLLARDGRTTLGLVVLEVQHDQAEIRRLWVDPAARGTGAGRALVRAALERAGGRRVSLTVWDWRSAPIALYRSLGFVGQDSWDERERLLCMAFQPDQSTR
ncbi:GNAT family N-acetyltransferase [Kineosporia sp. J2-2]|uniref:GNAT family N-acetyltransferase n=1 Tax=Kineosporia corallincola TaxID=2835133 RepID=A0ABS5T8U1_9ACTN|nr:GNAT family N-acetyltransferase [Kineosporia corallincola]MBT0767487.1 GNAT family N-acetyltransferase [Kineosporia corallincola]